jgi:hypothetical protein
MNSGDQSVRDKVGLLRLAEKLGNVTQACNSLGFSRDSYYRFKALYERGGEGALRNLTRRKPVCKNRVVPAVEEAVVASAFAHPSWGQERTSSELKRRGVTVSSSGVRSIWQRHDLETSVKRAQAIHIRAIRERLPLSAEQQAAVTRYGVGGAVRKNPAPMLPGEICYQNYTLVGDHQIHGPLYQHVFIDSYSRFAFVRVEREGQGISPSAFLATYAMPWFAERSLAIETIRVDRRAPFSGEEAAGYKLMLERAGIAMKHRLVKAGSSEDPCTAFEKILDAEFYQKAFREGLGEEFLELQTRLQFWLKTYNEDRQESRAACYGDTPCRVVDRFMKARDPGRKP